MANRYDHSCQVLRAVLAAVLGLFKERTGQGELIFETCKKKAITKQLTKRCCHYCDWLKNPAKNPIQLPIATL